jgi:hypothetical protein
MVLGLSEFHWDQRKNAEGFGISVEESRQETKPKTRSWQEPLGEAPVDAITAASLDSHA